MIKKIENEQSELSGKYLTFILGEETYGIEILKAQEIIGLMPITKFPNVPDYVRGIINLRGKVIPVIDLRSKFNMSRHSDTDKTCIIVTQIDIDDNDIRQGILVDEVSEVIDINSEEIEKRPDFGSEIQDDFVNGIGKVNNKVVILLEIEKIVSDGEFFKRMEEI